MEDAGKLTAPARGLADFEWAGGHLALDFANTLGAVHGDHPRSYLHDYEDLLAWCRQADLIGPRSQGYLSAASPRAKAAAFKEAQALVESLRTLFAAAARHQSLSQPALDHLNSLVHRTAPWRQLTVCRDEAGKLNCGWEFKDAPPYAVLGPIVWRAIELLEQGPVDRVKECPAENCGWLFLDTSKNRSRQWCSMKTCGNLSKVRRFREKRA